MVSNQGHVSPDKAGLLVSPQASSTVGDASDITIPSGHSIMMSCAQWTPEQARKGRGQSGEGGDGAIPYVIIPPTHSFFT